MASMVDSLAWLVWSKTKDAEKNRNHPKSVYKLLANPEITKKDCRGFNSAEDFERARLEIIGGKENGN